VTALRLAALLMLLALTPAFAAGKPPKNKTKNVEVANLNILHGFACDPPFDDDGDQCRVVERIDLLIDEIAAAGCPDIVTLQENVTLELVMRAAGEFVGPLEDTTALIRERLPALADACGFAYEVVFDPVAERTAPPPFGRGIDEELILSRYPVSASETRQLYGPLRPFFTRHVLFARVEHPEGPVDVFTTHLASGSDLATAPCGVAGLPPPLVSPPCPASCVAFVDTVRECQAKLMARFVEARHDVDGPAILTGDFNAAPGSREYLEFVGRGWIDSHLAAGNPECDPSTGAGCTSGREDSDLSDLESPALNQTERIDFIFVVPPAAGSECSGVIQAFSHPQRAATTTALFAAGPREPCGPAPLPTCFVSDHSGNQLNLSCQP
jgi:endonuclease/exonuclease/phosphatase family metal-dependent hydrolase